MGDFGGIESDRLICLLFRGEGGTLSDRLRLVLLLELLSLSESLLSPLVLEDGGTGLSDMVKVNLGKKSLELWEIDDNDVDEF